MFYGCQSLKTIPALKISLVTNSLYNISFLYTPNLYSVSLSGITVGMFCGYSNTGYQCNLSKNKIIDLFTNLVTIPNGTKMIYVSGNPGYTLLTASDRLIATGKGWNIG